MDFLQYLPKNMRENIVRMRAEPKLWAKFQLNIIKYVIVAICILIGWQFVKVIIGFNSGSSPLGMVMRVITFIIMLWVFYTIYRKAYIPQRDRLNHYVALKTVEKKTNVDVEKVIDKALSNFKEKEAKIK